MKYYHATKDELPIGKKVKSTRNNSFYKNASKEMDKLKPLNAPGREKALFLADDAEFAVYFLMKNGVEISEINLYEVEPECEHKAPFVLTHKVEKRLQDKQSVESLIAEYWNPQLKWGFYEYLTLSFTVKKRVSLPEIDESFVFPLYDCDVRQAEKIS
ncbi:hypothetical protein [Psychromonas aquimarina]|uniref:hypothetical protein n=1 Tax=Psychromonas aquimarina TaxID=444919 RepID=UPI0004213082|nr:hypothetical protein [Psychromonas aquimarina]